MALFSPLISIISIFPPFDFIKPIDQNAIEYFIHIYIYFFKIKKKLEIF